MYFPRFGRTADELCVTELGSVIWAVQMATVEFHPWNSRRADVEQPDEWRIDLDPMPEASFDAVRRVAHVAREVLDEIGAVGWPKTSGGNGLHIYVRIEPRWGFGEVREAALAFAREVERRIPADATTTWWRKDRDPRKVFVDYNQNARDHTIASAYSVRGNPLRNRVDADHVGRARRRRPARVHDRDRAGAVRRDRRPARRDRRRRVLARAAARVGGARRGLGAASRHPWDRAPRPDGVDGPMDTAGGGPYSCGWCTISTSQCAWCATESLTLWPSRRRTSPGSRVPITIMSALRSLASWTIASAGSPIAG